MLLIVLVGIAVLWWLYTKGAFLPGTRIDEWAKAIAEFEGFYTSSSVARRNNNPGNLRIPGDAGQDDRGFGIFSTPELGWDALKKDLSAKVRKYPDFTLLQIMTRYLGGNPAAPAVTGEGNPFNYARFIAEKLGVSIESTLRSIFGG